MTEHSVPPAVHICLVLLLARASHQGTSAVCLSVVLASASLEGEQEVFGRHWQQMLQ